MTTTTDPRVETPVEVRESRFTKLPVYLTVGLIATLWTIPSLGLLINSFREPSSIREDGWWTVFGEIFNSATWSLENYKTVLDEGFSNAFANTVAVSIPAVVIPITIAAFAAYAFAWMKFPGRNLLFVTVVGLMVVPLQMALIPVQQIYAALGLLQAGIAFAAGNAWILAMLVPALAVLHFGVIRREERYLARKFGADYAAYRARVRRWI